MLADLWSDEDGASIVEYVLLIALIAVVCIAAIQILGTSAKNKLEEVGNQINTT
ncbi:MAG: Flp family type IVb pilin [Armatimonadetes bacterium]|nr:Flp family type IVb pilin [Armatimonadota bacterium]